MPFLIWPCFCTFRQWVLPLVLWLMVSGKLNCLCTLQGGTSSPDWSLTAAPDISLSSLFSIRGTDEGLLRAVRRLGGPSADSPGVGHLRAVYYQPKDIRVSCPTPGKLEVSSVRCMFLILRLQNSYVMKMYSLLQTKIHPPHFCKYLITSFHW